MNRVRWLSRFLLTSLLACGLAYALSLVPEAGFFGKSDYVFGYNEPFAVSNDNLVDYMLQLPLETEIRKVDLSKSVLSVDLAVAGTSKEAPAIFHDLYVVAVSSLQHTSNIDRVLIRIVASGKRDDAASGSLFVAMDAKRSELEAGKANLSIKDAASAETYVRGRFDLTFTRKWQTVFANSSN